MIDAGECRVVFETDEHWEWDALCAEADSRTAAAHTGPIVSWKEAAVVSNRRSELRDREKGSGSQWETSVFGGSNVQCALRSAAGELVDKASIHLGTHIRSITAQWLPHPGEDGRRRAVVACTPKDKRVPAILHFITPKR